MNIYSVFKTSCLFVIVLIIPIVSFSQNEEILDSLILKKAVELKIQEVKYTTVLSDTSFVTKIKHFNKKGQIEEQILPKKNYTVRTTMEYDSLGRVIRNRGYEISDTTILVREFKWSYVDDDHFSQENLYYNNYTHNETIITEWKDEDNAVWLTELITDLEDEETILEISKYTDLGDSLRLNQYITFDQYGNILDLSEYYDLKRRNSEGNLMFIGGPCSVSNKGTDKLLESTYFPEEVVNLKINKSIQRWLYGYNGYSLGKYHSYEEYNSKNQKIQVGLGEGKLTNDYNSDGLIIRSTSWLMSNDRKSLQKSTIYTYKYFDNGLPKLIEKNTIDTGSIGLYKYDYKYYIN